MARSSEARNTNQEQSPEVKPKSKEKKLELVKPIETQEAPILESTGADGEPLQLVELGGDTVAHKGADNIVRVGTETALGAKAAEQIAQNFRELESHDREAIIDSVLEVADMNDTEHNTMLMGVYGQAMYEAASSNNVPDTLIATLKEYAKKNEPPKELTLADHEAAVAEKRSEIRALEQQYEKSSGVSKSKIEKQILQAEKELKVAEHAVFETKKTQKPEASAAEISVMSDEARGLVSAADAYARVQADPETSERQLESVADRHNTVYEQIYALRRDLKKSASVKGSDTRKSKEEDPREQKIRTLEIEATQLEADFNLLEQGVKLAKAEAEMSALAAKAAELAAENLTKAQIAKSNKERSAKGTLGYFSRLVNQANTARAQVEQSIEAMAEQLKQAEKDSADAAILKSDTKTYAKGFRTELKSIAQKKELTAKIGDALEVLKTKKAEAVALEAQLAEKSKAYEAIRASGINFDVVTVTVLETESETVSQPDVSVTSEPSMFSSSKPKRSMLELLQSESGNEEPSALEISNEGLEDITEEPVAPKISSEQVFENQRAAKYQEAQKVGAEQARQRDNLDKQYPAETIRANAQRQAEQMTKLYEANAVTQAIQSTENAQRNYDSAKDLALLNGKNPEIDEPSRLALSVLEMHKQALEILKSARSTNTIQETVTDNASQREVVQSNPFAESLSSATETEDEPDSLLEDAENILRADNNNASVSNLQRKLGIGYGRAARIIDSLEARGIVGPSRGPNKPREVFQQESSNPSQETSAEQELDKINALDREYSAEYVANIKKGYEAQSIELLQNALEAENKNHTRQAKRTRDAGINPEADRITREIQTHIAVLTEVLRKKNEAANLESQKIKELDTEKPRRTARDTEVIRIGNETMDLGNADDIKNELDKIDQLDKKIKAEVDPFKLSLGYNKKKSEASNLESITKSLILSQAPEGMVNKISSFEQLQKMVEHPSLWDRLTGRANKLETAVSMLAGATFTTEGAKIPEPNDLTLPIIKKMVARARQSARESSSGTGGIK